MKLVAEQVHVFLLLALMAPAIGADDTSGLPAAECVRLMRDARIARTHDVARKTDKRRKGKRRKIRLLRPS